MFKYSLFVCLLFLNSCRSLSIDYENQVLASKAGVDQIEKYILQGKGKHAAYNKLAQLGDDYGPRLAGGKVLEHVIDLIVNEMKTKDMFDQVHTEEVQIKKWTRIKQVAQLVQPRNHTMSILALGSSVGTTGVLNAEAVVVKSFAELDQIQNQVAGKIVVYNQPWSGYSSTAAYRRDGASKASKYGAVATLIRSVTDFSINSPHTGSQTYAANITEIPTACITVEDAEMLQRYADRNITIEISLEIVTERSMASSRNIVAELRGSTHPEEVIIFGGHIDSWDVGTGSMDDGGGCLIAWQALKILKELGLKTKRTIRVVLWTAEEIGLVGGLEYYNQHMNNSGNVSLIMESDHGVFKPKGIQFSGTNSAKSILQFTLDNYLKKYNMTEVVGNGASSDTSWWVNNKGVPGIELYSHNAKYFYFHHSEGDTMTVLNADDLDYATLLWSTIVYVVGNMDEILPRVETNGASTLGSMLPLKMFHLVGQLFRSFPHIF